MELLGDQARLVELRSNRNINGREFHSDRLPDRFQEDADLQKAIEESKKTAQLEERRRRQDEGSYVFFLLLCTNCFISYKSIPRNRDADLQKALELSEQEAIKRRMRERDGLAPQLTGNSDNYQP
jgi:hypothetical protein